MRNGGQRQAKHAIALTCTTHWLERETGGYYGSSSVILPVGVANSPNFYTQHLKLGLFEAYWFLKYF